MGLQTHSTRPSLWLRWGLKVFVWPILETPKFDLFLNHHWGGWDHDHCLWENPWETKQNLKACGKIFSNTKIGSLTASPQKRDSKVISANRGHRARTEEGKPHMRTPSLPGFSETSISQYPKKTPSLTQESSYNSVIKCLSFFRVFLHNLAFKWLCVALFSSPQVILLLFL
jgi:hypothetical protein